MVDWDWVCRTNTLGWEQCDVLEAENGANVEEEEVRGDGEKEAAEEEAVAE